MHPPLHPSYVEVFEAIIPELKGWRSTVDQFTQDLQNRRYLTAARRH